MAKILITADIHIDNYVRYNPSPEYRLNQFDKLSDRLNKISIENNCKEIWIAGDIINKSVPEPKILHKLKCFLENLKSVTPTIRFIRGQHDMFGKSRIQSEENSNLNLFDNLMEYMDHKIIDISSHRFAFMDWSRNQDLSWIKEKVDVMIGHVGIGYGQDWDRSKFKIGFFGDIHMKFEEGNCISISNPIQHRISDDPDGSVIILDTETLKWKRVRVKSSDFIPLTMKYTEEGLGYNSVTNCWEVKKKIKASISTPKENIEITELEFDSLLNKEIEKSGLIDIHKEVVRNCSEYHPINFNFQLKNISIHNIKGISDFSYGFDGNLLIVGKNGSGKSSFILSIYQLLTGSMEWDRLQRRGYKDASVKGDIIYDGKTYSIIRSKDENRLFIDGKEIPYKDKREFKPLIEKYLPFVKYYNAYYFNYWVTELLRDSNNELKIKLVSKFNGLDIFDNFLKYANESLEKTKAELKDAQKLVDKYKVREKDTTDKLNNISISDDFNPNIENLLLHKLEAISSILSTKSIRERLNEYEKVFNDYDGEDFTGIIDSLNEDRENIIKWESEFDKLKTEGKKLQIDLNKASDDLNRLRRNPNKCPKCGQLINSETYGKHLSELEENVNKIKDLYDELRQKYKVFKSVEESKKSSKYEIEQKLVKYKNLLDKFLSYQELKRSYNGIKLPEDIIIAFDPVNEDKEEIDKSYKSYREYLRCYKNKLELEDLLKTYSIKLSEYRKSRDELKDRFNRLTMYLTLISKDGPIFLEILKNLMAKLSNEQFKFKVTTKKVRSEVLNNISVQFWDLSTNEWRNYEDCSQGQKSLCDTYFLSKLLNGVGILVFDEYYSHVDDDYLPLIAEMLNSMDVNNILLSTHSNNFQGLDCDILTFPI